MTAGSRPRCPNALSKVLRGFPPPGQLVWAAVEVMAGHQEQTMMERSHQLKAQMCAPLRPGVATAPELRLPGRLKCCSRTPSTRDPGASRQRQWA